MTVILPAGENSGFEGSAGTNTILEQYNNDETDNLLILHQKKPEWNEKVEAYTLSFKGRVTQSSVKNFQLAYRGHQDGTELSPDQEILALQFGKIGPDKFTMDVQWPLSISQAFGICLSSFDPKLACDG
jgi:tubby-related protein 1